MTVRDLKEALSKISDEAIVVIDIPDRDSDLMLVEDDIEIIDAINDPEEWGFYFDEDGNKFGLLAVIGATGESLCSC